MSFHRSNTPVRSRFPRSAISTLKETKLESLKDDYEKLKTDYNEKVEEVSTARVDLDDVLNQVRLNKERLDKAEEMESNLSAKLKLTELDKYKLLSSKDKTHELEHQLNMILQRIKENQSEIEEARSLLNEQSDVISDVRKKYLEAEQTAEEQRRQMDVFEYQNERMRAKVGEEIVQVNAQFKHYVNEYNPLPEALGQVQQEILKSKKEKNSLDRTADKLKQDIKTLSSKYSRMERELNDLKNASNIETVEKQALLAKITKNNKEIEQENAESAKLKASVRRLEAKLEGSDRQFHEKKTQVVELFNRLETLREESARQISSSKKSGDTSRKSLRSKLSQLEKELARTKAAANAAERDRDEVRMRMKQQVESLGDSFAHAQQKIRHLQNNVAYLSSAHPNVVTADRLCGKKCGR